MIDVKNYLIRIYGHEGGYVNRPLNEDPGGETKWGISKRTYPKLNIKDITLEEAEEIYKKDYIAPFIELGFPPGLVFQLVDFAIHSSVQTAIKCLQFELGLPVDGVIGRRTKAVVQSKTDSDLVMLILAARLDYMSDLKNWLYNSKGWARRIAKNLRYGAVDTD